MRDGELAASRRSCCRRAGSGLPLRPERRLTAFYSVHDDNRTIWFCATKAKSSVEELGSVQDFDRSASKSILDAARVEIAPSLLQALAKMRREHRFAGSAERMMILRLSSERGPEPALTAARLPRWLRKHRVSPHISRNIGASGPRRPALESSEVIASRFHRRKVGCWEIFAGSLASSVLQWGHCGPRQG